MKPGGVPDESRAARVILKDLVTGKLLFTKAPPDVDQVWTQNAFLSCKTFTFFTFYLILGVEFFMLNKPISSM